MFNQRLTWDFCGFCSQFSVSPTYSEEKVADFQTQPKSLQSSWTAGPRPHIGLGSCRETSHALGKHKTAAKSMTLSTSQTGTILLAEDDPGDVFMLEFAFTQVKISNRLVVVENGQGGHFLEDITCSPCRFSATFLAGTH